MSQRKVPLSTLLFEKWGVYDTRRNKCEVITVGIVFFVVVVISLKKLFLKGCFVSCEKVKECCGGMGHSLLAGSLAEPVAGGKKDSFCTSW